MGTDKPKIIHPITKRRRELKLSQQALADILCSAGYCVTRQNISGWETGRHHIPADKLPYLDRALDLMDGTLYYALNLKRHGGDE